MSTIEVNFDGLVGPTHNYAGLSFGNLASENNLGDTSRPKAAALQGLTKMQFVSGLGLTQGLLPPLKRPFLKLPRQLGFTGSDEEVMREVVKTMPQLLSQIYSASNMWVANAATVSPSADCSNSTVNFTAANLVTHMHRSIEAKETEMNLRTIFADKNHFSHHAPLPAYARFGDEGAANIMRFTTQHGKAGLEVLVYGENTKRFPARQTEVASETVLRRHGVQNAMTAQQSSFAIDEGVFHNDVIAVANENVLLYHEHAFEEGDTAIDKMEAAFGHPLIRLKVMDADVSVKDAVTTYLFNSQLITLPDGSMAIIAPTESEENAAVAATFQRFVEANDNPIQKVHYLNLRESMKNGGGPACLRLRVALNEVELAAMHQGILFTDHLHERLGNWVETHYREALSPDELSDINLMHESFKAHEELNKLLELPT
ncbi:MAG: N-succinylarginine dihydrolase [Rickettsiales bacterium]|nr:N-succinylarginine dihydrolase [Rickettsiales bacterium]